MEQSLGRSDIRYKCFFFEIFFGIRFGIISDVKFSDFGRRQRTAIVFIRGFNVDTVVLSISFLFL